MFSCVGVIGVVVDCGVWVNVGVVVSSDSVNNGSVRGWCLCMV